MERVFDNELLPESDERDLVSVGKHKKNKHFSFLRKKDKKQGVTVEKNMEVPDKKSRKKAHLGTTAQFIASNLTPAIVPLLKSSGHHPNDSLENLEEPSNLRFDDARIIQTAEILRSVERVNEDVDTAFKKHNIAAIQILPLMDRMKFIQQKEQQFDDILLHEIAITRKESHEVHKEDYFEKEKEFEENLHVLIEQAKDVIAKRNEQKMKEEETTRCSEKHDKMHDVEEAAKRAALLHNEPFVDTLKKFLTSYNRPFIVALFLIFFILEVFVWLIHSSTSRSVQEL